MIKNITSILVKKTSFLVVIFLLLLCHSASSQNIDITLGVGTATNSSTGYPCPLQDNSEGSRAQYLFKATELKAAGMDSGKIYSVSFKVTAKNTFSGSIGGLVVKMGATAATALTATTWAAGTMTQVYGPLNFVADTGKNTLTFTTPFDWDGLSNVLVEICNGDPNNATGTFNTANVSITQSTTSFNSSHTRVANNMNSLCDSATTTNIGTQTLRPNFTFSWLPKAVCNGVPVIGAATATPATVCLGQNVTLTLAGLPVVTGLSLEWQDSIVGSTGFTALTGGTTKTFVTTQSATTWYRIKVTCTNTNDFVYSNVVVVTTNVLPGGVYTIDNQTTTFPLGTSFKNFNAAYNAMKCGITGPVTFNVVTGTGPYTEQLIINGKVPGSSTVNTITFNGNGETIKYSATTTNERAVIKLKNTKYFIFDSLKVDVSAAVTYGIGFHLTNNADTNIIRRCTILASPTSTVAANSAGIAISGSDANAAGLGATLCDWNVISGNTIIGGYHGITLTADFAGSANGNNTIYNNTIKDFYRYGIYVNGSYNTAIEQNRISRPTRATVDIFDGIYFTGQSNSTHIFRNRIFSPFKAAPTNTKAFTGINLDNASASATNDYKVDNNLIYDVVSLGNIVGINNNGTANAQYFNNTISLDDDVSTAGSAITTKGFNLAGATSVSIVFADNLISITRGGTGTKHCIYLASGVLLPNIVLLDYNDYFIDAATGNNYIGYFTSNRLTLGDWQTAVTPNDISSLAVQPVYYQPLTNPLDTANYSPTNAAMDDKGLSVGNLYGGSNPLITVNSEYDILNAAPQRLDIGCYEFIPPPCVPGSLNGVTQIKILGKTILTDTTVCENTFVNFNVKIFGPYGTSQSFQWQRVTDTANAPANYGGPSLTPDTTFQTNDTSYYYRCKISCLGVDYFTNWRKLNSIPAMPVGNYTINGNTPTNYINGVPGSNFVSYDTAVKTMRYCGIKGSPGNVVFKVIPLSSGNPYQEQVKIDSISGATVNRQVVFKGNYTTLAFPTGQPTNNAERALIKITKADFINFDSLNIDATTAAANGYGVQLLNNADSNSVKNCNISVNNTAVGQTYAGIVINGSDAGAIAATSGTVLCDGNVIDNNTITGGYYGVAISSAATIPSAANIISNNKFVDFYSTGVYVSGTDGTVVDHNIFSRPARANVAAGYGVYYTSATSINSIISNNRFSNFYGGALAATTATYGIYLNSIDAGVGKENRIFNNVFYNFTGLGAAYALYNNGSDYALYFHNSIALDLPTNAANATASVAAGFYQTVQATGLQFVNNIVHITRGGTAAKHCINLNTAATATAGSFYSNKNVLYVDPNVNNGHIGYYNTNKTTMTAWQNAFTPTPDSLSFNYDPLFTDEINGNLKPQFYLIDNQADNTVGVTTDILGVPRTGIDIGAYEFNAPVCPSPLLAGTASVNPSSGICLEIPVHLSLSGNSPVGQINFQWQDATSAAGPWQNLGPLKYSPVYDTISSVRNFYRCIVTCAATGASVISTVAQENLNTIMPGGTYTIDNNLPTNYTGVPGQNFHTVNEAVLAMQCGILNSVVFDVQNGIFNEQVRVPYVPGTSATSTVTFQGNSGVAAGKTITWAGDAVNNYTLRFDSASFITFKNLTIENTSAANGRVVDFIKKASYDNVIGCVINTPATTSTNTAQAAIFSSPTKGVNITLKANTITGGSNGIYFTGTSQTAGNLATIGHVIDSNIISNNYGAGIFVQYTLGLTVSRNKVSFNAASAAGTAGIYANYCDSGFNLTNNRIDINNVPTAISGIQVQNTANSTSKALCSINGNEVYADAGNTGKVNGISITSSNFIEVKNNVVAVNSGDSTGTYGLISTNNNGNLTYYHNTINITAPGTKTAAAQLTQTTGGSYKLLNNIFSNNGGGRAMFMSNFNNFASNYNMLFTTGAALVNAGNGSTTVSYVNIVTWRKASNRDKWSIVIKPAFVNTTDLHPDATNPYSWAIQGRAIQTKGDVTDINGNYRPDSLTAGVPDLGAYEFHPSVQPPILPSIPATPALAVAAGVPQVFYFGSDTVMRIKWDTLQHPDTANVRRFSGVVESTLNNPTPRVGKDSMFFYTSVETAPNGHFGGDVQLYYIDPWLGSIPTVGNEYQLGLGRTNAVNKWTVGVASRNEIPKKRLYETGVSYMDKFTGLINPYAPPVPGCSDTSNAGHEFWVAYPAHDQDYNGGLSSTFQLYIAAQTNPAYVTIESIDAITGQVYFQQTLNVPAGTVQVSALIPHTIQHFTCGTYEDAIHIVSDESIVAYAHCFASSSSGATMLMPVCTYGYEYKMLSKHELQTNNGLAYYIAIASQNNTKISYNSVVPNCSGTPQSADVVLNKGEWLQIFAGTASTSGGDLSGSLVKSVPNDQGICLPFAFFSGDGRTYIKSPTGCGPFGGDFAMQQSFPASAWGRKYVTAPTSLATNACTFVENWYRIALKDAAQLIKINGTQVYPTGAAPAGINNYSVSSTVVPGTTIPAFIEFSTVSPSYIESSKPIMVAQFLSSDCGEDGDPDMVYLSPLEQGINEINFYRNTLQAIDENVLTLVGSTTAPPVISEIIGSNSTPLTWSCTYPIPATTYGGPSKTVYVKLWSTSAQRQVNVISDSTFTAVTYGLGSVESYMYNAGTNIISYFPTIKPPCNDGLDSAHCKDYTCGGTSFRIRFNVAVINPDSIIAYISHIPGIHPSQDVVFKKPYNPAPQWTLRPNGDTIWTFTLPGLYKVDNPGTYTLEYKLWSQEVEGCDKSVGWQQILQVLPAAKVDFAYTPNPICPNTLVKFTADSTDPVSGLFVNKLVWQSNYGLSQTDSFPPNTPYHFPSFFYGPAGSDTVKLHFRLENYCVGDTSHILTINPNPVVTVVADSLNYCAGSTGVINISAPLAGATYTVYSAATGGTVLATGNGTAAFTFPNLISDTSFYIECVSVTGCVSVTRKQVKITITQIPTAVASPTNVVACIGTSATFNVAAPIAGAVYTWYDAASAGNVVGSGNTLTITTVVNSANYYLEVNINGCISVVRFPVSVVAATTPSLAVVNSTVAVCSGDNATFSILNPDPTVTYNWYTAATGGTAITGTSYTISPATASASYYVSATSVNGCTSSPRLKVDVTVTQRPVVTVAAPDSVAVCKGSTQTFNVLSPVTGAVYDWYDATNTIVTANNSTFVSPPVNGHAVYTVKGSLNGCVSITNATVKVDTLVALQKPVVYATKDTQGYILYTWLSVPGATGYLISIDDSVFKVPNGNLQHLLSPVNGVQYHKAVVEALGDKACQNSYSDTAFGSTITTSVYYPNTFSPGGSLNKTSVICGVSIKALKYQVFNQWGQKIWETSSLNQDLNGCYKLWDGTHNGVLQPSGVYMYASRITYLDGKVEEKTGSINLIR